ncbi:MAG TPA: DUF6377 domain-containing protein, partial [Aquaticitalea sp.]|nr:DUF6377 domain-containing protein [Aquaticitalea sp.]
MNSQLKSFSAMHIHLILLFFLVPITTLSAFQDSEPLEILDRNITHRDSFIHLKYQRITQLKKQEEKHLYYEDDSLLYDDYLQLFKEYRSFRYDSAYYYLEQAKQKAFNLKDSLKLSQAKIKEGFVLMSSGLFKEALDTLQSIKVGTLPDSSKFEYYAVKARAFYDLADYTRDDRFSFDYIENGNRYLDLALVYVEPNSNDYWNTESLKQLKMHDWEAAQEAFTLWLDNYNLPPEYEAIATSSLAYVYAMQGDTKKNIEYLTLAAIADIKNATKETVALRNLASELFKLGDMKRANRYISLAMEDATFYNARHRKVEISSILPIIERAFIQKTERQKRTLTIIVFALSILGILVIIFLIIIIKQLRVRSASRRILAESNLKLQELNTNLKEADSIKQEYITHFLKVTSGFIHKIDQLQKSTLQKIMARRPEEVLPILKKYSVKKERAQLFNQFDEIFLKLFPTFKENYYNLFPEQEQVLTHQDESLNNEMRIFALYRLGVQDSKQVADFLELSVATIYSYKTRTKAKSNFKDNFEEKIMEIKQF